MAATIHRSQPFGASTPANRSSIASLAVLLTLVLVCVLSAICLSPPAVVPATAPATMFSAARAMIHLREIAQYPHPTGSPENARVRGYLVDQLEALGLQPEVQQTSSVSHDSSSTSAAVVHNVMARIPGSGSTGALLLLAHYDSVATSPGASDDGSGVVSILETARALLAGPALQNDVIVLFTDAEEIQSLGAHAFVREHPWMAEVRLVLNLEARGASGPVVLFETSDANAELIREYAGAAPRPVTSSLLPDIYRLLPNDTDLTVFLLHNVPGLNFAYADSWTNYHTGRDSIAEIDERSVQHHGLNLLALTRRFGNRDLRITSSDDAVFFSVLSRWVFHYSQRWVIPLLLMAALGFLILLVWGCKQGQLSVSGVAFGGTAIAGCAAALAALGYGCVQALNALEANELSVFTGGTYNVHWYELGFLLLFIGAGCWLIAATGRRLQALDRLAGTLLVWLALAVATGLWLPGASYLFIWPLLAGLAALALQLASAHPVLTRLSILPPAVVGILLVTPALYLVLVMAGITGVIILGALVVLLLGMVLPPLSKRTKQPAFRRLAPALLAGGGVTLVLIVALTTNYDSAHPRQNALFYSLNADTGQAAWVAAGQTHEPWARSFTGHEPASGQLSEHFPLLTAIGLDVATGTATTLDIPAPDVTVLADSASGSTRTLRLHIASRRGANQFAAVIATPGGILSTSLYGNAVTYETPQMEVMLNGVALPSDGVELTLVAQGDQPLAVKVADVTPAPADGPGIRIPPRPDTVTGMAGGSSPDATIVVHHTVSIPAQH